ncbi:MAG: glycosyltransferase family 2 protein [Lentisphaeria bacterium]|nr:glycosyltransferase family 2 protein [Lentisphaeria bacterium]
MPKISVIVPCYNAEKWLTGCIGSLSRQTFSDFEIVAVDDASKDNTREVLIGLARQEGRLKICRHDVNMGVSAARNTGMASARGEFMAFLDADDELTADALEQFLGGTAGVPADLICLNAAKCDADGNFIGLLYGKGASFSFNPCEERGLFYANQRLFASACVKLYRRSLIQRLNLSFHPDLRFGEDTLFVHQYAVACQRVVVNTGVIAYHYLQHSRSTVHTINLTVRLSQLEVLIRLLHRQGERSGFGDRFSCLKCAEYIWSIRKYAQNKAELEKTVDEMLKSLFYAEILRPVLIHYGKIKHRMLMRMFELFPELCVKLW